MKSLLFLPDNGIALQVRRGSLCVRGPDGRAAYFMRCEGVALYLMCLSGEAFAIVGEGRGQELRITGDCPDRWRKFTARSAGMLKGRGGTSKARHAASPAGAMLNYAFAVALGQCTRACIAAGLDPCHGFLHRPKPGRLSLAYDVLELHRADLTSTVFGHVSKTRFASSDFKTDTIGVVTLNPEVARDMAVIALRTATMSACCKSVARIVAFCNR